MSFYTSLHRLSCQQPRQNGEKIVDAVRYLIAERVVSITWPLVLHSYNEDYSVLQSSHICLSFDELSQTIDSEYLTPLHLYVGSLASDLAQLLNRLPLPDGSAAFALDSVSIHSGPILHPHPDHDSVAFGNFALEFHGPGYVHPWTHEELLNLVRTSSQIASVVSRFQELFAHSAIPLPQSEVALYPSFSSLYPAGWPPDSRWLWAVLET